MIKLFIPFLKTRSQKEFLKKLERSRLISIHEKQRKVREKIYQKIVDKDYTKNHLQHYRFLIDGDTILLSIVEIVNLYGYNVFIKAEKDKIKQLREKEIKNFENNIKLLNY